MNHFKGLIYGKVEPKDEGCSSTITLCHAQLKKAILHLKTVLRGNSYGHFGNGAIMGKNSIPLWGRT